MIITNIGRLVTMEPVGDVSGPLGVIEDAAIEISGERISWLGRKKDLRSVKGDVVDAKGGVVMPGLIDAHTHIVHGGYRQNEFAARLKGASYEEIIAAGGGIMSTVEATRSTSRRDLLALAKERADESLRFGVTTMEIKSGYGLDVDTELKILEVIRDLNQAHPIDCIPTFLGAHTVPKEYKARRADYVRLIIDEMLPLVSEKKLAQYCDVFVEDVAFNLEEARAILTAAKKLGLKARMHVDQLKPGMGAELGIELQVVSIDHLEHVSGDAIKRMSKNDAVAVLCPGSTFFMRQTQFAPARALIDAGVKVAIATDYNPGTSPTLDLFLVGTIAATRMGMTLEEVLTGMTLNAARSLGLQDDRGSIAVDKRADLLVLNASDEYYPLYRFGTSFVASVVKNGAVVYSK